MKNQSITWVNNRASDAEFQEFVNASHAEDAMEKATKRCTDTDGHVSASLIEKLKQDYLDFCRTKWDLPADAGRGL